MTTSTPPLSPASAALHALPRPEPRRVTSYDVAMLAGVSQSAVSRCFQPGASVSKATHARVMQAAQALDYIPNAAARSLITRRSNLVAVVASSAAIRACPELLCELSHQFGLRGMRILLFSVADGAALDQTLSEVWQHQVDGAVVAARLAPHHAAEFDRRRVPLVLFGRSLPGHDANAVLCDQPEAARTLVNRLALAGHRRFAMIDGPPGSAAAQERRAAVLLRLDQLGLPAPLLAAGGYDHASGVRGLRAIVKQLGGLPDAVLCGNDEIAIGCLDTARHELGLEVPRQLSIAGFDGLGMAGWRNGELTTLRQPVQQMALAAAEILAGLASGVTTGVERRVFSATLVEGGSARLQHDAALPIPGSALRGGPF